MFNIKKFVNDWAWRQKCLLRRPLIEKYIEQTVSDKIASIQYNKLYSKGADIEELTKGWDIISSFFHTELWHIQSVVGTDLEKCKISPGMLHKSFLEHGRKQARLYMYEDKLHLKVEKFSILKILYIKIFKKGKIDE